MKRLIIATGAVIAFLLAFSIQSASAQDVMYGCVGKKGQLRIVGGPGECKSSETEIWWNQRGPQGELGEPGLPGQDGDPGPPGPAGEGCVKVHSAIGEPLGTLIDLTTLYIADLGVLIGIDLNNGRNMNLLNNVMYDQIECEGKGYTSDSLGSENQYYLQTLECAGLEYKHYVLDSLDTQSVVLYCHRYRGETCVYDGEHQRDDVRPLTEVNLSFTYPIVLPLVFE